MAKIIGPALPNIPWEDRPAGCLDTMWRSSLNPIVPRDAIPCSNSIFNSAVVPFEGKFAGVFRIDDRCRNMRIHAARSEDAIHWDIDPEPVKFLSDDPEIGNFVYGYDPRCCKIDDKYIVTWCNGYHGPTIGMAYTYDFKSFHQMENSFLPFNRNGVMFPRKIGNNYAMLSRPSDNGHTPFGDIFYSESPDLTYWGKHRHVLASGHESWCSTKVGAGPIPIETDEGWLLFFHGVLTSCNGFVYSFGAMLLDLDEPWKVIARARPYLLNPRMNYECVGDVPNVAFPCAALADSDTTGRISIYYGGADTVICMAHCTVDGVVDFIKQNKA